mgnify:CR=1 FL=1
MNPIIAKLVVCLSILLSNLSYSADQNPCDDQNGGSRTEGPCMAYKLALENQKLNQVIKAAQTRASEENEYLYADVVNLLKKSQEAWLLHRAAHCEFEGLSRGASGGWSQWHIDNCALQMTLERIKYLNAVFYG